MSEPKWGRQQAQSATCKQEQRPTEKHVHTQALSIPPRHQWLSAEPFTTNTSRVKERALPAATATWHHKIRSSWAPCFIWRLPFNCPFHVWTNIYLSEIQDRAHTHKKGIMSSFEQCIPLKALWNNSNYPEEFKNLTATFLCHGLKTFDSLLVWVYSNLRQTNPQVSTASWKANACSC